MALPSEKKPLLPSSEPPHPYLHGNFAPVNKVQPLTPCCFTGQIPDELVGGQYIRNGGNPVSNEDLGRDAHWFDGDGMLAGVLFQRLPDGSIQPEFVNQYILTDVYLSAVTTPELKRPILPSISTLVNPKSSLLTIILRVLRTIFLVILSHLPGSKQAIRRISASNTGVIWHDGRALMTCESGPPMRVSLPTLETVGWFDGVRAENEAEDEQEEHISEELALLPTRQLQKPRNRDPEESFGGTGLFSFMKEWTTAHPRVDPITGELILFHSTFIAPYVHYSIIPSSSPHSSSTSLPRKLINSPVPGITAPKMMHDFGVSPTHTIILDLPLSLSPLNLLQLCPTPVVHYSSTTPSRFGVFPRHSPFNVHWFETSACCIFHTANTWDDISPTTGSVTAVNMLACRLTSASVVFSAGNLPTPAPTPALEASKAEVEIESIEEEQCRLHYYRFQLASPPSISALPAKSESENTISHSFPLSPIPFEFPSVSPTTSLSQTGYAKYIYGCTTTSSTTFSAALGRAVKIDALVKIDVQTLIARGKAIPPPRGGCVDSRSVTDVLALQREREMQEGENEYREEQEHEEEDPITIFALPPEHYAQEPRFVPRNHAKREDDGFLLTYVFDERQLDPITGEAGEGTQSELWVLDVRGGGDGDGIGWRGMTVVAKIELWMRVPYGLHGKWFGEECVSGQRGIKGLRKVPDVEEDANGERKRRGTWLERVRGWAVRRVA